MKAKEILIVNSLLKKIKNKGLNPDKFFKLISLSREITQLSNDLDGGFKSIMNEYGVVKYGIYWNGDNLIIEMDSENYDEVYKRVSELCTYDHEIKIKIDFTNQEIFECASDFNMSEIEYLFKL